MDFYKIHTEYQKRTAVFFLGSPFLWRFTELYKNNFVTLFLCKNFLEKVLTSIEYYANINMKKDLRERE